MEIENKDNILKINNKEINFSYRIENIVQFRNFCVLILMADDIPDNNIMALDYDGNELWNISDIIQLSYAEAYISLQKVSDNEIAVTSFNGLKSIVNVEEKQIIKKIISK